jgi:hypothetical protein
MCLSVFSFCGGDSGEPLFSADKPRPDCVGVVILDGDSVVGGDCCPIPFGINPPLVIYYSGYLVALLYMLYF